MKCPEFMVRYDASVHIKDILITHFWSVVLNLGHINIDCFQDHTFISNWLRKSRYTVVVVFKHLPRTQYL